MLRAIVSKQFNRRFIASQREYTHHRLCHRCLSGIPTARWLQVPITKGEGTAWLKEVNSYIIGAGIKHGYAMWCENDGLDWCVCPVIHGTIYPRLHVPTQLPLEPSSLLPQHKPSSIPLPKLAAPGKVMLLDMPDRSERDIQADLRAARIVAVHTTLRQRGIDPSILLSADGNHTAATRCYEAYINMGEQAFNRTAYEPIRRSAERVAHQIFGLIRQMKAEDATNLRNTDRESTEHRPTVFPVVMVLDNVRSAYNVGSLFRTAETAGVEEVITCGITCHPPHPKLTKTALSATELVQHRHFDDVAAAIDACKSKNYSVFALETTNEAITYDEIDYPSHGVALVFGNEMYGVDPAILAKCDRVVQIPTFGVKNSLNVASAAPIAVYEVIRQWRRRRDTREIAASVMTD